MEIACNVSDITKLEEKLAKVLLWQRYYFMMACLASFFAMVFQFMIFDFTDFIWTLVLVCAMFVYPVWHGLAIRRLRKDLACRLKREFYGQVSRKYTRMYSRFQRCYIIIVDNSRFTVDEKVFSSLRIGGNYRLEISLHYNFILNWEEIEKH